MKYQVYLVKIYINKIFNLILEDSILMNQQNQPQYKPVYYLQRPHSPKNLMNHANSAKNISLTMSIGANQTSSNFLPAHKTKP